MRRFVGGVAILTALVTSCTVTVEQPSPTLRVTTSTTTAPSTTTTTVVSTEEAIAQFESCLEEAGLGVEPIPLDAEGRPRFDLVMPRVDFADQDQVEGLTRCARILSNGPIRLEVGEEMQSLVFAALAEFAECVREHGVEEFPDPHEDFAGVGSAFPPELIPLDDPGLETATRLCADRMGG